MRRPIIFITLSWFISLTAPSFLQAVSIAVVSRENELGQQFIQGVKIAVDEQNKLGGISGEKIDVIIFDDQGKPEIASNIAQQKLKPDKQLIGVVGHLSSNTTLAAMPFYYENNIPLMVPTAQDPRITIENMQNIFRIGGRTDWMVEYLAIVLKKDLNFESVIFLYPEYMITERELFKKKFTAQNLKVIYEGNLTESNIQIASETLKGRINSGVIAFHPTKTDTWLFTTPFKTNRSINTVVTTGFSEDVNYYKRMAMEYKKLLFVLAPPGPDSYPEVKKVFEERKASSNFAFYPYLSSRILLEAAIKNYKKGVDHKGMIAYIKKNIFLTPVGKIRFDEFGNARWAAYAVYRIESDGVIHTVRFNGGGGKNCCPPDWCCENK